MTIRKFLPLLASLILSCTVFATAQTVTSATYNADDQLSTETYDANGNTLTTGGNSYIYDSENHLIAMNGGAVKLVYDGDGNLVIKTANGVTTQYLVDDQNPTGLPQVVEETVNGAVQRKYSIGHQRISQTLMVTGAPSTSYYGYDGQGNVRQLTNAAGVVTDTYNYDAFGNLIGHTGTTPNHFLYRGERYDTDLKLYYLRARWYNPVTGRFMSRDSDDGNPTDPASLHKYLYAGGDPVNKIDPTGRYAGTAGEMPIPASEPAAGAGGDMAEYGMLVGVLALGTVAADKKLACSISTSLASEAVELMGGTAIPDESHCTAHGCKPCVPPVGAEAYDLDWGQQGDHFFKGNQLYIPPGEAHWHLLVMNQSPYPMCQCFWQKTKSGGGFPPGPPPDMDEAGPAAGGGIAQ